MLNFLISLFIFLHSSNVLSFTQHNPNSQKLHFSLSPVYLSRLANREVDIYSDLKAYNSSHSHNFPFIHDYLQDYETSTLKRGHRSVEQHPLLVYRMIKRYWHYVQPLRRHLNATNEKTELELYQKLDEKLDVFYPNATYQFLKTAEHLMRIQHVADIKAEDIIRGRFENIETGIGLTPKQILEFAKLSLDQGYYYTAIDLLNQPGLDYDENATYFRDQIKAEIIHEHDTTFLFKIERDYWWMFEKPLSQGHSQPIKKAEYAEWIEYGDKNGLQREIAVKILGLCSHQRKPKLTKLKCWNDHKSHPYFTIAPTRAEKISESPDIFLFYDVIGDKAIKVLELSATTGLEDDVIFPDSPAPASYSLIPNEDNEVPLASKLEEIFKLHLKGNDLDDFRYTLIHYGGDGDFHHDSFRPPNIWGSKIFADRISTYLLYTRDVELGGETVFPLIDVAVKPQKGMLLYWYNYDKTGIIDWQMTHGLCPPILGVKSYLSNFIPSQKNMFNHKCGLTQEDKRFNIIH